MKSGSQLKFLASYDGLTRNPGGAYSFLNLASLGAYLDSNRDFERIYYFCDGFTLAYLISMISRRRVVRVSFDFTSIADDVFLRCVESETSVYMVGGTQEEVQKFAGRIVEKYRGIDVAGYHHGFIDEKDWAYVVNEILRSKAGLVIVGMGAGKQDAFLLKLIASDFSGSAFSCGGFIRQTANSKKIYYYPRIVNTLGLRAIYRMVREPYTIPRYLISYPTNFVRVLAAVVMRRVCISVVEIGGSKGVE